MTEIGGLELDKTVMLNCVIAFATRACVAVNKGILLCRTCPLFIII